MSDKSSSQASKTDLAFFEGLQQARLLGALEAMYERPHGLAVIAAPPGAGCSALIRHFFHVLRAGNPHYESINCALIDAADNTVAGFLSEIILAFGYQLDDATQSELLSLTRVICHHQTLAGVPPLLAIEHIELARPKILDLINELAGLRHGGKSICRLILTGGENVLSVATAERMNNVRQRISTQEQLERMDEPETRAFIQHVLGERALDAHETAIDSLLRLSKGLPGNIVKAINYASRTLGRNHSLSSGDVLLAIESSQLTNAPESLPASEATQIQRITLESTDVFDEGAVPARRPKKAPLGEILVNCNGKLLQRYVISRRKVLIGRAPHNDIVLESRWVSRHHAILICSADKATLSDINSTNGLTLNSRELRQGNLMHNDIIVIGDFRLKYINENARRRPTPGHQESLSSTRVLRSLSVDDLDQDQSADVPAAPAADSDQ